MHIAIITAGGAGMFCGSCMHDNAWARALIEAGHEVSLVPTYTPLRLDEPASPHTSKVFLGGVNVYLDARSKLWRAIPRPLKTWLDNPVVLNAVSSFASRNDYSKLGDLTLAMLEGERGPEAKAIDELAAFLEHLRPDAIILSNVLLAGIATRLKQRVGKPMFAVLQGDDVFLDALPADFRQRSISAIRDRLPAFDRLLTHTRFYRGYMASYLGVDASTIDVLPLSVDGREHTGRPRRRTGSAPTVGFLARFAPEKGLHHLVDAMELVRKELPDVRLHVAGYRPRQHAKYFNGLLRRANRWNDGFKDAGSPETLSEKTFFLEHVDVLSVPTEFLEPKGLYVLEALANGTPVVQPAHGSFPELLESTGGGWLAEPRNPESLAEALLKPLTDSNARYHAAEMGYHGVRASHSPKALAEATIRILTTAMSASSA
ncbi:MAG TPA: glycosyltransferase family 4 protein [Caulifigura sp.]|nr:glycosyltransferase family 4 protein [Caulifigura sp.]